MPWWNYDPDRDIEALARDVRAGLVVGTWEYPDWKEREKVFPRFNGDRDWSWITSVLGGWYTDAGAASAWAELPPFAEGFVKAVDGEGNRVAPPYDLSRVEIHILSTEQWHRLAPLIGSPKGYI